MKVILPTSETAYGRHRNRVWKLVGRARRLRWDKVADRLSRPVGIARRLADRAIHGSRYVNLPSHVLHPSHLSAWSIDPGLYPSPPAEESDALELRAVPLRSGPRLLFPPYRYERPAPRLLGDSAFLAELEPWMRIRVGDDAGVGVVEAILDRAILLRDAVYIASHDGVRSLYESARAADRGATVFPHPMELRTVRRLMTGPDPVFMGGIGGFNYGHFLTDDLTRLSLPRANGTTEFLLTDHGGLMNSRREELLRIALAKHCFSVRFLPGDVPVEVAGLRYASRASRHPVQKSPDAVATMVDRVMAGLPERWRAGSVEKLLIARTGVERRGLTNLPEITAMLAERGFQVLDPMTASAAEQIAACAGARCIVGVMGAAMANTVFARPGADVVHLAPEGWLEPYYWDLAAVRGHRYTAVYGPASGEGAPWMRPFHIDPADLRQALD